MKWVNNDYRTVKSILRGKKTHKKSHHASKGCWSKIEMLLKENGVDVIHKKDKALLNKNDSRHCQHFLYLFLVYLIQLLLYLSATTTKVVKKTRRSSSPAGVRKNDEAIKMSMFPGGKPPAPKEVAKIEREDWPGPPSPAALLPEISKSISACTIRLEWACFPVANLYLKRSGENRKIRITWTFLVCCFHCQK